MTVGERIRQRRRELSLTQEELASRIGTIKQTIYKYETDKVTNIPLDKLRALSAALRLSLSELTDCEAGVPGADGELLALAASLNPAGRRELLRYGRYLAGQSEFAAAQEEKQAEIIPFESVRTIRHYLVSAAAGYAAPIEGEDYELIPCAEDVPAQADFCLNVSGDSMEPFIHDGDTVYVQSGARLDNFDVGIFYYDGDVFIKQLFRDQSGAVHLLSANPARTDANRCIPPDSGAELVCFGRALLPKKLPRPSYWA